MFQRHLVLMVKAPEAGRVKTRLANGIGVVGATRFYRAATTALARRIADQRRWKTWLAIAPDRAVNHPVWPIDLARRGQGGGDLGQRMQKVVEDLSPGPVVIIGSDIPGITCEHISQAFQAIGSADIVIGPAPDGGYWLIGFKRRPKVPNIFQKVRWSHPETLTDTLRNAAGLKIARLGILDDVDEAEELSNIAGWSGRIVLPRLVSAPRPTSWRRQTADNSRQS
jgi:uncharacterized protein